MQQTLFKRTKSSCQMLEKYVRGTYQNYLVEPIAAKVQSLKPDLITLSACLIGLLSALFLVYGQTISSLIALALSGYLDTIDGTVARKRGLTTSFGCALDIVCDRIVEFSIVLGFYFLHNGILPLLMLGSILICVTTFLVVGIFTENKSSKGFHYSEGLIERAEAFIFFALMIMFPGLFYQLSSLFVSLVLLTAGIRLYQFKQSFS